MQFLKCLCLALILSISNIYSAQAYSHYDKDNNIYYTCIFNNMNDIAKYTLGIVDNKWFLSYSSEQWSNSPDGLKMNKVTFKPNKADLERCAENIKKRKADFGLFAADINEKIFREFYIKAKRNPEMDYCTLNYNEQKKYENEYIYQMNQDGFSYVKEHDSGRTIFNRYNTFQFVGYNRQENLVTVKSVISRYGRIVEIDSYAKLDSSETFSLECNTVKVLESYLYDIGHSIDYDSVGIIDESLNEEDLKRI